MADAYLTTALAAHFNRTDMDLVLSDVLDASPFLSRLAATTAPGITYKYAKRTANAAVGFRSVNDGLENYASTYTSVTVDLKVLDASFAVDIAACESDERGADHLMAIEAMAHMRQAMREVEEQIFYGTGTGGNASGFSGFMNQTTLDALADTMVVNAAGTTASTASSVYAVRTGMDGVEVVWGQSGVISIGERQIVERAGSVTGRFPAYYHPIVGWVGLKVGSAYSVGRIANLTEDSGKGLTDDLIADLLSRFPIDQQPNLLVMNRRSWKQLQQSRTATNPTGAPAPFPLDAFGIPIVVTDSLLSTEALET